jgi:hypothetical protein
MHGGGPTNRVPVARLGCSFRSKWIREQGKEIWLPEGRGSNIQRALETANARCQNHASCCRSDSGGQVYGWAGQAYPLTTGPLLISIKLEIKCQDRHRRLSFGPGPAVFG